MKTFLPIILILLQAATATAGALTLLSPKGGTYVETGIITLVVRADFKGIDDVRLLINGKDAVEAATPSGDFHYSFKGVHLATGMNSIRLTGFKEGKKADEITSSIFYRSDISSTASSAPYGYNRYYFHTEGNEKTCTPCHTLVFSNAADNPSEPQKSPCYLCHSKLMADYTNVHGPAAVWSCLSCHEPGNKVRKMATMKPDEKVCAECHEFNWRKMKNMHGPTAAGSCTTCHNPHAANESYFLRLDPYSLCVACHDDIPRKPHVISGFSRNSGHPVRLSPDPLKPGRDFTCNSCHNPHATDFPLMLSGDYTSMFTYCQTCHRM